MADSRFSCYRPLKNHYFPTLHQFKYELEDGYNPHDDDSTVRFGFDEAAFPDFSWRGYAVFSRVQTEIRITIDVDKPSVFRLIFRYMNRNLETVNADVLVTPDDPQQDEQVDMLSFPPTEEPDFLTTDTSFVLNPARWTVTLKTERDLDVVSFFHRSAYSPWYKILANLPLQVPSVVLEHHGIYNRSPKRRIRVKSSPWLLEIHISFLEKSSWWVKCKPRFTDHQPRT